jgi:hypothetical protein
VERTKRIETEIIQSDPVAFDAALDAKIAGKSPAEQRQAALDAYRYSKGLPRITVDENATPIPGDPFDSEQNKNLAVDPKTAPASQPQPLPKRTAEDEEYDRMDSDREQQERGGDEVTEDADDPAQRRQMELLYARWSLARVRQDSRGCDFDVLEQWQIDDVLALRGRRMDFAEWMAARFPDE